MITISIPSFNRSDLTIRSFISVLNDSRVSEIVINDDASNIDIYADLCSKVKSLENDKIKVFRNSENIGSFLNKRKSVSLSTNEWVILLDSDNIVNTDYLDIISNRSDRETIYCPSHAVCNSPMLDYSKYVGSVDKKRYQEIVSSGRGIWDCILNTGNYFFHRDKYLECIEKEPTLVNSYAADAYYLIFLWFKNLENPKIEVVDGLKYIHELHLSSHWVGNSKKSDEFLVSIINMVRKW